MPDPHWMWTVALGISTFLASRISLLGIGLKSVNDGSVIICVSAVSVYGANVGMLLAIAIGQYLSHRLSPDLTGGWTGAMYNFGNRIVDLAITGFFVEALHGHTHPLVTFFLAGYINLVANIATMAPVLLSSRELRSATAWYRYIASEFTPISENLNNVFTLTIAAIAIAEFPWVALMLLQGPVLTSWSRQRQASELAISKQRERTDSLTALPNRRWFEEYAASTILLSDTTGLPVSLLILDLDNFKAVNDIHGHATGDEVLAATAQALRTVSAQHGESFLAARVGGEEFALLAPDTSLVQMSKIAERVRIEILHAVKDWNCSASIGVSQVKPGDTSIDDALECADQAMYVAKSSGKNCVVTYGDAEWVINEHLQEAEHAIHNLQTPRALSVLNEILHSATTQRAYRAVPNVIASIAACELHLGLTEQALRRCNAYLAQPDDGHPAARAQAACTATLAALALGDIASAADRSGFLESVSERTWPLAPTSLHVVQTMIMHAYHEHERALQHITQPESNVRATPWSLVQLGRLASEMARADALPQLPSRPADISPLDELYLDELEALHTAWHHHTPDPLIAIARRWAASGRPIDADATLRSARAVSHDDAASCEIDRVSEAFDEMRKIQQAQLPPTDLAA